MQMAMSESVDSAKPARVTHSQKIFALRGEKKNTASRFEVLSAFMASSGNWVAATAS
jgi:hypothetical protein